MYDTIVCAIGLGSREKAYRLIETSRDLLAPGGTLHLVHAVEGFPLVSPEHPEPRAVELMAEADHKLSDIGRALPTAPILHVRMGRVAHTILEVAKEVDADLIVVAAHQDDILDKFFGSTVDQVAHKARCSVHLHRSTKKHRPMEQPASEANG
jgi:nucleotide-binding universal stress UspA family protein